MRPQQEGLLQLQKPVLPDLRQEGHRPVDLEAKANAATNPMATHHADDALGIMGAVSAEPAAIEKPQSLGRWDHQKGGGQERDSSWNIYRAAHVWP